LESISTFGTKFNKTTPRRRKMSLNSDLQDALEWEFRPRKILAFTNCCHERCSGTYLEEGEWSVEGEDGEEEEEDDETTDLREKGIFFIRLHLNGGNYKSKVKSCFAKYTDFDYLREHWAEEKKIIDRWCSIVLKKPNNKYTITFPPNKETAIRIEFETTLQLDRDPTTQTAQRGEISNRAPQDGVVVETTTVSTTTTPTPPLQAGGRSSGATMPMEI